MYYKATFDDFKLGTIYQERIGEGYITKVVNEESFELQPGGYNEFSEILYNLKRVEEDEYSLPYYRIKKLDESDILSLGFIKQLDDDEIEEDDPMEYKLGKYTLFFNSNESLLNIYMSVDNSLIRMFIGKVLNMNELTILLLQLGILESGIRNKKIK